MARTPQSMLKALLDDERLTDDERSAFGDISAKLRQYGRLLPAQLSWVERTYLRLELDADEPAQNWVSDGKVARKPGPRLGFEDMPRPLKPPGR